MLIYAKKIAKSLKILRVVANFKKSTNEHS